MWAIINNKTPISKRFLDLVVAIPGLILLSPVLGVIALVLFILEGRPVIFRQDRPGFHGNLFTLYKFRTMHNAFNRKGKPLADSERLFPFGRFLRSTSLDELPELVNIIRGEMSLVGPRPLLVEYLELYTPDQSRRHDVLPGLTGWAQINGRNAISWEDKFNLDLWYVDHWSFGVDIHIILLTIRKVLMREGISIPGQDTTEKFRGSENSLD